MKNFRHNRTVRKKSHMCVDVQGALNHYKKSRKHETPFTDDEGRPLSRERVVIELHNNLIEGKRVIPMGECYRFCFQKGCKGHITSINPTEERRNEIEKEFTNWLSRQPRTYC